MNSSKIFQFLRGAVRGTYGIEDFRKRSFLIVGVSAQGQDLLNKLCVDGVDIKFTDSQVSNYYRSFAVCKDVEFYNGQSVDVIINFKDGTLSVSDKMFTLSEIGEDSYNQGISEFYL